MKKNSLFLMVFILVLMLFGCKTKNIPIQIYGKIPDYNSKWKNDVIAYHNLYTIDGISRWPDTLQNKFVKVTGLLEITRFEMDSNRQSRSSIALIKKPIIELIEDDSIMSQIDDSLGHCVDFRRFIQRIQEDQILDSLFTGDSIIFIYNKRDTVISPKISGLNFYFGTGKSLHFVFAPNINSIKKREYIIISDLPCEADISYDYNFVKVTKLNGIDEKKMYRIIGNKAGLKIFEIVK
jgi:hypothetical protein